MFGMQDTTVAFVASMAFGDEPHPPNLEIPAYSGRKLPPEVITLADEKAVTERTAAEGKLVDPKQSACQEAAHSLLGGDAATRTSAYRRIGAILWTGFVRFAASLLVRQSIGVLFVAPECLPSRQYSS